MNVVKDRRDDQRGRVDGSLKSDSKNHREKVPIAPDAPLMASINTE